MAAPPRPERELIVPRPVPTRTLSARPDLAQLRRQAKELLAAFREGRPAATMEFRAHLRRTDRASVALHDAQFVLARAYGFDSWPRLAAFVDGVTIQRLVEAIADGDLGVVRAMVDARPELLHMDVAENDEHQVLHHAVLRRRPDIVRFLMERGADARKGIWPHRAATTAFTLAAERGDDEIVGIIEAAERLRPAATRPAALPDGTRPVSALPAVRTAIAAGDLPRLEAAAASGAIVDGAGLVSQAVAARRPEVLEWLLRRGLDPDETGRLDGVEEVVPTWGAPLRACARSGDATIAAILLAHGANPNTNVYAASSALHEACRRGDDRMVALLEAHGGRLTPVSIAALGLVDQAARLLAAIAGGTPTPPVPGAGRDVVWDLLWGAIESPSPEIVELALRVVGWSRDDPRWHGILENGLYLGPGSDRARHLLAFRLVLERSDPSVRSRRGTTLLHEVAASRGGLTGDDRLAYATLLLDRGARLDVRDDLLESTPLGWACRWGRIELVDLLLARGADPIEAGAPRWAQPAAWAAKAGHPEVVVLLEQAAQRHRG
jgi:ankyrin repeat protein